MATKKPESTEIVVVELQRASLTFCVLGTSPLILNRMSEKARQQLLAPAGRKSTVEKASSLKHEPLSEYRASPYRMEDPAAPTELGLLPSMFKAGMSSAALRIPGVRKAEIQQLVQVNWDRMPVWGVPRIFCSVTRSADIARTPDIRTRAIVPEWATYLTVSFMRPALREQSIVNLLAAAGQICGCGDWRAEKGSGSFGSYTLVSQDNADFQRIVAAGGRDAQLAALENPQAYDSETEELLGWFDVEARRRGFKVAA